MKKILALVLVLALALSLVACGGGKDDEVTIAVIGQQTGNVVFLPAQEGALKAGEDLGINVEWQSPIRAEAELQNEIMNNLIDKGVDGIAISCTTGDALKDVIDRAISEGIVVSCYDVDKAIEGVEAYTRASGYPFINTGVQIATIDDYKEVMGLE